MALEIFSSIVNNNSCLNSRFSDVDFLKISILKTILIFYKYVKRRVAI